MRGSSDDRLLVPLARLVPAAAADGCAVGHRRRRAAALAATTAAAACDAAASTVSPASISTLTVASTSVPTIQASTVATVTATTHRHPRFLAAITAAALTAIGAGPAVNTATTTLAAAATAQDAHHRRMMILSSCTGEALRLLVRHTAKQTAVDAKNSPRRSCPAQWAVSSSDVGRICVQWLSLTQWSERRAGAAVWAVASSREMPR